MSAAKQEVEKTENKFCRNSKKKAATQEEMPQIQKGAFLICGIHFCRNESLGIYLDSNVVRRGLLINMSKEPLRVSSLSAGKSSGLQKLTECAVSALSSHFGVKGQLLCKSMCCEGLRRKPKGFRFQNLWGRS